MGKIREKIEELSKIINTSKNIVFFGGAGTSTESDIPDFRSDNGIYQSMEKYGKSPETILSHDYFLENTAEFYKFYKENMIHPNAKVNYTHEFLADLERQGKLKGIITQNIDGLHQLAGSKRVMELHGSIHENYCMNCQDSYDLNYIINSNDIPICKCGGLIKPDVVLYQEPLNSNLMDLTINTIAKSETLIIGGTSLIVYPAAGLLQYFNGSKIVIINKNETDYDNQADLVINESIGEVFKSINSKL